MSCDRVPNLNGENIMGSKHTGLKNLSDGRIACQCDKCGGRMESRGEGVEVFGGLKLSWLMDCLKCRREAVTYTD